MPQPKTMTLVLAALGLATWLVFPESPSAQQDGHHQSGLAEASRAAAGSGDGRRIIALSAQERDFVLAEMRTFLESVRDIVAAVADGQPARAADAAKRSGMTTMHNAPASLRAKLPPEFKALGMDTHKRFDALALEASGLAEPAPMMRQLTDVLDNCTACHAGFAIDVQ